MRDKILLIEDDTIMLSLLQTLLSFEGYEVSHPKGEENLSSLLNAVREEKPDLVLLDVHLESVNGFELLRAIRDDQELKSTHVIMTSGMDFYRRCKQEGADSFIQKPYMPEELTNQIRIILDRQTTNN